MESKPKKTHKVKTAPEMIYAGSNITKRAGVFQILGALLFSIFII